MSETSFRDNRDAQRFELSVDGKVAGFANYTRSDGVVKITHTEISNEFEGQGLGSKLARQALDTIKEEGAALVPACSFIRRYVEKHPEYAGLVMDDE